MKKFFAKITQILNWVIGVTLGIILLIFMVANRQSTTISFDPIHLSESNWHLTAPLFIWLFIFLIIGIIIGRVISFSKNYKAKNRSAQRDIKTSNDELFIKDDKAG